MQAQQIGDRSVAVPAGWSTAEDADGSIRIDAREKDVVINVGALGSPSASPLPDDRAAELTRAGLERLGATDVSPMPAISATPGTVHCAKGTARGNVIVFCLHDTATLRAGDPMSMAIFQGTPAGWARTGPSLLVSMLESMKGFGTIR